MESYNIINQIIHIVSNGKLTIEAERRASGHIRSVECSYYYSSSRIITRNKFDFRYGKGS